MLSPIPTRNYIIGFLFGILIPVLLIFIRNAFNNKIYDIRLLEKRVLAPVIGVVFRDQEQCGPQCPKVDYQRKLQKYQSWYPVSPYGQIKILVISFYQWQSRRR